MDNLMDQLPLDGKRDLELCSICDELAEIAIRHGDVLACYDCVDAADKNATG